MDDRELLQEYCERQSEQAFTELVQRYVNLVYVTAVRVVGEPQAAQDVVQSVFILLARKAWMVREGNALPGWLYRAAYHAALDLRRSEQRRRERETEAMNRIEISNSTPASLEKIAPLLDEALHRLSRVEQDAIILRYLEGKSLREAGLALAMSEQAAHKRVSRALEKMRAHFARGGVTVASGALAAALTAPSSYAAPAGLATNVAAKSLTSAGSLGPGGTFLKILYMTTKTKIILVAAVILAVAAIPVALHYQQNARANDELANAPQKSTNASPSSSATKSPSAMVALPTQAPLPAPTKASSAASASATQTVAATGAATVDPRKPSPGVYPNAPKLNDIIAAARANAGKMGGLIQLPWPDVLRNQYGNLMQKMQFTPAQADAFIKTLADRKDQEAAVMQKYPVDKVLGAETMKDWTSGKLSAAEAAAANDQYLQKINEFTQPIEQAANAQIKQQLGSDDNYDFYQAYTDQQVERSGVMGFADKVDAAGLPAITLDQEEQLVNLVYQALITDKNDYSALAQQVPQLLQQAAAFLSADQVELLKDAMPFIITPAHAGSIGG